MQKDTTSSPNSGNTLVSGRPVRIQRSRQNKQVSPNGLPIVYVGRPTKWGNPYKVGGVCANHFGTEFPIKTAEDAVNCYKNMFLTKINPAIIFGSKEVLLHADLSELKGKNLSCWCRLDCKCHADVLLELANR